MADRYDQIINEVVQTIRMYLSPKRILLFGSRAIGKEKPYSDFDVAIEGAEMSIREERLVKDACLLATDYCLLHTVY